MHNVTTFTATSRIVVIGSNPENADFDNPRGHVFGLAYYVQASNDHGDTWEQHVVTGHTALEAELAAKAERVAAALQARLANLGKLPVDAARWQQGRALYGSPAYVEYGADEELAYERREAADEAWA